MRVPSLDELWDAVQSPSHIFRLEDLSGYPEAARRYLSHAIDPGTPIASAVRLRMHGEIKLRQWRPFSAEQVISWDRGMMWRATARFNGLPVRGFDCLANGGGMMQWHLLGVVPVMKASGPDITRSAAGRVMAESVWLPSVLCRQEITWTAHDALSARAHLAVQAEVADLELSIDANGMLRSVSLPRWSNPDKTAFHYVDFGGLVEQEGRFGGFTIPTRLRIGYFVGTDRFQSDGEFFRATIDGAVYR